ncbi:aromatic acid exporter family protein [Streptomyces sp. NPDC059649]|uniref:FUSC family protein n=1 Tax=Streptomyces sp. NPDC059649 TaxID=3346895 RepID=UPI0036CF0762
MAGGPGERTTGHGRLARTAMWWQRARAYDGHERHTVLLILKSTVAATVGWLISYQLLHARSPAFAPFSAVLIMQVTVYQSLRQSLRYVGAVVSGVAVQAALVFTGGPQLATFALVALIALSVGRWPALGSQGNQVATAAFFAFATYTSATTDLDRAAQLGQIVLLVLIGCAVGLGVNVTLVPPMRYRSAAYALRALARTLDDLFADMHPVLRRGELDEETTQRWRIRAEQTEELIDQARAGLRTARESLYYNPRRLLGRHRGRTGFEGHRSVLAALERALHHVASLARSLDRWRGAEDRYRYRDFLRAYAEFLAALSTLTQLLSRLDEDLVAARARELDAAVERAHQCREALAEQAARDGLPLADPTRPYGVLVIEATRLVQEFSYLTGVLGPLPRVADEGPSR